MVNMTIPVERISAEARQLDPVKVLLIVVSAVPFALGWVLGKTWLVLAWLGTAAVVGWRQAHAPRGTTQAARR